MKVIAPERKESPLKRTQVRALFDALMAASGGRLRLVHNEADDSQQPEPEAAHFLKLDEKRLGRDLELYSFMSEFQGADGTLVSLLEEVVLPLQKSAPAAFTAGVAHLKTCATIFGDKAGDWIKLLEGL